LQERAQDSRTLRELEVGNEAKVKEAGYSIFQPLHPVYEYLLFEDQIEEHFPEILKKKMFKRNGPLPIFM
jgi:hypothetical protein